MNEQIDAIKQGIYLYKKSHRYWINWENTSVTMTAKEFLARVPADISVAKLRSLVKNNQESFCEISGAKQVIWYKSEYQESGKNSSTKPRNARFRYSPSQIEFVF